MNKRWVVLTLAIAGSAQAGMYKCGASYQDHPCSGGSSSDNQLDVQPVPMAGHDEYVPDAEPASVQTIPAPTSTTVSTPQSSGPACPESSAIEAAVRHSAVVPCMTPKQVLDAATPRHREHYVSSGYDSNGGWEIWVFPEHYDTFPASVKFRDGAVVEFCGSCDMRRAGYH